MAHRSPKPEVHEHHITCPYCRTDLAFNSPMERILSARRTCPKCEREIFIDDGIAVKMPTKGSKKLEEQ